MGQSTIKFRDRITSAIETARRGGKGFLTFTAAVVLSPLVVLGGLQFVNDVHPRFVDVWSVFIAVVAMLIGIALPLVAIYRRWAGRPWVNAGLILAILGWGGILLFLMYVDAAGFLPNATGAH